jgi:hypothetical protein
VLGFDVEMLLPTALAKKRVRALLGKRGIGAARGKPVMAVELVANADVYEVGGALHRPELLLGLGFALDYGRRRLLYPENSPLLQNMKNLGMQNPLTRTIIFCIALLAEHNGAASINASAPDADSPLYLHASAVLTPKGALVFCGACTFGKTTISTKLLKKFPLLEDDQVTILIAPPQAVKKGRAVKSVAPRVVVFGDSRKRKRPLSAISAPLAGIFFLKKTPENALESMEQAEACALLMDPTVNWKNASAIKHRLSLFRALLTAVPCRRLSFKKESAPLVAFLTEAGYIV